MHARIPLVYLVVIVIVSPEILMVLMALNWLLYGSKFKHCRTTDSRSWIKQLSRCLLQQVLFHYHYCRIIQCVVSGVKKRWQWIIEKFNIQMRFVAILHRIGDRSMYNCMWSNFSVFPLQCFLHFSTVFNQGQKIFG